MIAYLVIFALALLVFFQEQEKRKKKNEYEIKTLVLNKEIEYLRRTRKESDSQLDEFYKVWNEISKECPPAEVPKVLEKLTEDLKREQLYRESVLLDLRSPPRHSKVFYDGNPVKFITAINEYCALIYSLGEYHEVRMEELSW